MILRAFIKFLSLSVFVSIAVATSTFSYAQLTDMVMSREQYSAQLEQLFKRIPDTPPENNSTKYEIMKKHLSDEQLAQMKKEDELILAEKINAVANCIGISTQQVIDARNLSHSSISLNALKQCSSELPDTVAASDSDYTTSPKLERFNDCFNQERSKSIGFDTAKLQQCETEVGESDNF